MTKEVVWAIEKLSKLPTFWFVIVLAEPDNRFVAYVPWETISAYSSTDLLSRLIDDINHGREAAVRNKNNYPGLTTRTVRNDSKIVEALKKMNSLKQEAIVVVDEEYRFQGVVERDSILSHMMVELAGGQK